MKTKICQQCKKLFKHKLNKKFCNMECYKKYLKKAILKIIKRGKDHPYWKGENAAYSSKHGYIIKYFGKANKCEFDPKHKASYFHWANISGQYKRNINDWIMLCPKCHKKFDQKSLCKYNHEFNEENTTIIKRNNGHINRICKKCRHRRYKKYYSNKKLKKGI